MMDGGASGSHRTIIILTLLIQAALAFGLICFIARREWERAFLTLVVVGLIVIPACSCGASSSRPSSGSSRRPSRPVRGRGHAERRR
jgi:hypothetical protein